MKSAALEFGEHKITVNAVIPGLIDTPLTRHRQRYAQAADEFEFEAADSRPGSRSKNEAQRKVAARRSMDRT